MGRSQVKGTGVGSRLYHCWNDMHKRCRRSPKYVEKGITVCEEWALFEPFKKWAKKNGYKAKLTLDRIDNAGNYCPENCRWASPEVQTRNRDITQVLTYQDMTRPLAEWAASVGLTPSALRSRLRNGWSMERSLMEPPHARQKVKKERTK